MTVIAESQNTLTYQELQAAYLAEFDLGPGYPQLEVAEFIKHLYVSDTIEELSLRFAPLWTPERQAQVDDDLERSVRRILRIADLADLSVLPTFSGSVALDRALAATVRRCRSVGEYSGLRVVTTSPSIDIMRLFLEERAEVTPLFVESRIGGAFGALDTTGIVEAIQRLRHASASDGLAVLLTSPENPTGSQWSRESLLAIANACAEAGAVLIADHSFALAGIHEDNQMCRIWDLADQIHCDWLAVWDTGKTFGLNEDKLGFLIPGTDHMEAVARESFGVLQFGVARRQKMFFAELLRLSNLYGHVEALRAICRENLAYAEERAPELLSHHPAAGSLLLLDIASFGQTDEEVRRQLLKAGIGLVAGNVFFHTQWRPTNFVRLALARRPDYFREAFDRTLISLSATKR